MKPPSLFLFAGLLALLPLAAQAKIERVVEKTFAVAPGGRLHVETQGGNIHVTLGAGNDVKVTAREHFRAQTEAQADEIAERLSVTIEQSGADVTAKSKYANGDGMRSWFSSGSQRVSVDFEVTVPSKYNAQLRTSGGNVSIANLGGDADVSTSGGNIDLGKIEGRVDARTSGGNITISDVLRSVKATTSGGDVHVGHVTGQADLSTSGGNIHVEGSAGVIHAETSGGDVSARFVENSLPGESVLKTSGGNVNVRVNPDAAFRLDASTSGGSVRVSGIAMDVQSGGNGKMSFVGIAHGGGPELKLRTSGGDVRVTAE